MLCPAGSRKYQQFSRNYFLVVFGLWWAESEVLWRQVKKVTERTVSSTPGCLGHLVPSRSVTLIPLLGQPRPRSGEVIHDRYNVSGKKLSFSLDQFLSLIHGTFTLRELGPEPAVAGGGGWSVCDQGVGPIAVGTDTKRMLFAENVNTSPMRPTSIWMTST